MRGRPCERSLGRCARECDDERENAWRARSNDDDDGVDDEWRANARDPREWRDRCMYPHIQTCVYPHIDQSPPIHATCPIALWIGLHDRAPCAPHFTTAKRPTPLEMSAISMVRRARAMASRSVVARMVIRAPRAREGALGAGAGAPRSWRG